MKGLTRHIAFTFLLCFSVLFSSVGMTLQEHFCLMSGEPVEQTNDHCCTKDEAKAEKTDGENCCELHTEHQKLEPVQQLKTFSLQLPAFFPAPQTFSFVPEQVAVQQTDLSLFYSDSSPPLAGRNLLTFIQILIV
ncbi:MAG: hypothetical protein LPJ89_02640 [Hymenobacteraceae bacterium]|nr:hypothetical protein [Hymenobacteraceae bacterium]MDX5394812.1 hypothetical protein [Hymenobacteraceae bacterium]MDX5442663.1 hypothetical protein [Hymenobacteraceae bacterium]MDX5510846.1 hypothetical protein [Hymenobacteraceae bacterium]